MESECFGGNQNNPKNEEQKSTYSLQNRASNKQAQLQFSNNEQIKDGDLHLKVTTLKDIKSFLKTNEWNIECLMHWPQWEEQEDTQKQELKNICKLEKLMVEAKQWLQSNNSNNIEDVFQQEKFQCLKEFKKFKRWATNKKFYEKNKKSTKQNREWFDQNTTVASQNDQKQNYQNLPSQMLYEQPLQSLKNQEISVMNISFKERAYEEWHKILKKCESLSYNESCQIIKEAYFHDPIIFIEILRTNKNEQKLQNIFSILLYILTQLDNNNEKINLFLTSCNYYNEEILNQDLKTFLYDQIFKIAILRLQIQKNINEIIGFIKLIFVNSINIEINQLYEITMIMKGCPLAWKLFIDYIMQKPFSIRNEVAERLPMNGLTLKYSMIQLLKETKGFVFLKVPDDYRKILIEICIYSHENDSYTIKKFCEELSEQLQSNQCLLEKAKFFLFLSQTMDEVKLNQSNLKQGLDFLYDLLKKVISGIVDGRIINSMKVVSCLKGDLYELNDELQKQKSINIGGFEEQKKVLQQFKNNNKMNEIVNKFQFAEFNNEVKKILESIQNQFGRPFHNLQLICMNFLLSLIGKGSFFIHFGTGNGKTLLSTALTIIVSCILKWTCIILVKSQYLQYRDFKKYKLIIEKCGIVATQQEVNVGGITFMEEKHFFKNYKTFTRKIKKHNENILVIIDEFDQIFDEYRYQNINDKLKILATFKNIVGLTGSKLSKEEDQILKEVFQQTLINFPSMHDIYDIDLIQSRSLIFTNCQEWINSLCGIIRSQQQQTPILLALDQKDINLIKSEFKEQGIQYIDLVELHKKQSLAELQTIIEYQFNQIIDDQNYGAYFINTDLGRGTDFPTSSKIEENGGIYLILGDVYSSRTTEQFKGRICRMQNKGKYQYIVNMKQGGNTFDYIKLRENILNLKLQTNIEQLLIQIREWNKETQSNLNQKSITKYSQRFFQYINNSNQDFNELRTLSIYSEQFDKISQQESYQKQDSQSLIIEVQEVSDKSLSNKNENIQLNEQILKKRKASQKITKLEKQIQKESQLSLNTKLIDNSDNSLPQVNKIDDLNSIFQEEGVFNERQGESQLLNDII